MRLRRRSLVPAAVLAAVAATLLPTAAPAGALPPRARDTALTGALMAQVGLANTGGKLLCPASLTADGSAAWVSLTLPTSSSGPDRSGIYRRDLLTGAEQRVLATTSDAPVGCSVVSPDGQRVAFTTTGQGRLFLLDTTTGGVTEVPTPPPSTFHHIDGIRFSADHRFLYFVDSPPNWVLARFDTANPSAGSAIASKLEVSDLNDTGTAYSISANGQQVALTTRLPDGPAVVAVYDYPSNKAVVASMRGGQPISGDRPILSADGATLVYEQANTTTPWTGGMEIARMNLVTAVRTSLTPPLSGSPTGTSQLEDASADGKVVAFTSSATNLVSGVTFPAAGGLPPLSDHRNPVFVIGRDGATRVVTVSASDHSTLATNGGEHVRLDAAGEQLVFASDATDLVAGYSRPDGGGIQQVYAAAVAGGGPRLVTTSPETPTIGDFSSSYAPDLTDTRGWVSYTQPSQFIGGAVPWVARLDTGAALPVTTRQAGTDRYATAALVSKRWFDVGVPVAYVASGEAFPDALAAGPVAAHQGGPVLLTAKGALPDATKDELVRLRPKRIVVVGGTTAVADAVVAALDPYTDGTVTRVAGADRYETAVRLSQSAFGPGTATVHVATGDAFADALSGGPVAAVAATAGGPLLLVRPDGVPPVVAAELARLNPSTIVVLGGTTAVSDATAQALGGAGRTVVRRAGTDRYLTSVAVSAGAFAPGVRAVYLATGASYPDALAASAVAGRVPGPVLLTRPDCVPGPIDDEIARLHPEAVVVLGGDTAVSAAVVSRTRCAP